MYDETLAYLILSVKITAHYMKEFSFSLLVTVYEKTLPDWLNRCLESIQTQKACLPDEIIIVEDGPIPAELHLSITQWQRKLPLVTVKLPHNLGAGGAAAAGLDRCSYDWVARLDADDMALPNRFSRQIAYLKQNTEVDVLSGYLAEFSQDAKNIDGIRKVPLSHQAIVTLLPYRSPINNTCVIFRKRKAQEAGGYDSLTTHEDYFLWMKMLGEKAVFANIPEVLSKSFMGKNTYKRRRGSWAIKQEWIFQNKLLVGGYISVPRYLLNLLLRMPPRLLPIFLLRLFYRLLLRD